MQLGPGIQYFELREAVQIAQHIENIAADLLGALWSIPGLWLDWDSRAEAFFNQLTDRFLQLLRWQCTESILNDRLAGQEIRMPVEIFIEGSNDYRTFLIAHILQELTGSLLFYGFHTKLEGVTVFTILDHRYSPQLSLCSLQRELAFCHSVVTNGVGIDALYEGCGCHQRRLLQVIPEQCAATADEHSRIRA